MANQFALSRRISARLTQDVLRDLVNDGILAKIDGRNGAYLPSRDLSKLSVADVARTVLHEGAPPLALGLDTLDQNILSIGDTLNQSLDKALAQPIAELLTTP
jgi:DNA-binding IscR family transcriptional regulator